MAEKRRWIKCPNCGLRLGIELNDKHFSAYLSLGERGMGIRCYGCRKKIKFVEENLCE